MSRPRSLNNFEARQFALLLLAGVPHLSAATYFLPPEAEDEAIQKAAEVWVRQPEVTREIDDINGGAWVDLSKEERWEKALDKLYAEMAFFLWSHNYGELTGADKLKADTCRAALESKIAGTAGQGNAIERFYEDLLRLGAKPGLPKIGSA